MVPCRIRRRDLVAGILTALRNPRLDPDKAQQGVELEIWVGVGARRRRRDLAPRGIHQRLYDAPFENDSLGAHLFGAEIPGETIEWAEYRRDPQLRTCKIAQGRVEFDQTFPRSIKEVPGPAADPTANRLVAVVGEDDASAGETMGIHSLAAFQPSLARSQYPL